MHKEIRTQGQSWRRGTKRDCKNDWFRFVAEGMKYLIFLFLSLWCRIKAQRRAPEFSKKWEPDCVNTRFPLPTIHAVFGIQRDAKKTNRKKKRRSNWKEQK